MPRSKRRKPRPIIQRPAHKQPGASPLLAVVRSHRLWRVVAFVVFTALFQSQLGPLVPFWGDEPHYLLGAISLLKDGDSNVYNNYQNKDYKDFGYRDLKPQGVEVRPGVIPTEHGIGFPLIIALPYAIAKLDGVRAFLILLGVATALLVGRCCDFLTKSLWAGDLGGAMLIVSLPWQIHARLVYPECFAGFVTALLAYLLLSLLQSADTPKERFRPFAIGLLLCSPVIYLKYTPLIAPFGLLVILSTNTWRGMRWFYRGFLAGLLLVAVLVVNSEHLVGAANFLHGDNFKLVGSFDRYWRPWFDRNFGLAVFAPWVVLSFFAMPFFLARFRLRAFTFMHCAALSVLGYSLLFAPWLPHPGASEAGRYLCAAMPLMVMLVVVWCWRERRLFRVRLGVTGVLLVFSMVFSVASICWQSLPLAMWPYYAKLFGEYWTRSWDVIHPVDSPRPLAFLVIAVVCLAKLAARWAGVSGHSPAPSEPNLDARLDEGPGIQAVVVHDEIIQ